MISEATLKSQSKWPLQPLGEVVEFLDHKRVPVTESLRIAGPFPYYGANGPQGTINDFIFDEQLILLAEDGGNFGDPNRTIAYRVEGPCWVNNHAHVLRPLESMDWRYLCRQLEHYDVTPIINGATRAKLTKSAAEKMLVAVPPLSEQIRIAASLDKADAIRKKRREVIMLADEFLRSVFLDMFGDPVANTKGLSKQSLGELIKLKSGNFLPSHEMAASGEVPVYGGNGINGYHDQHMFNERQVVIGRVGAYCGVVHVTEPRCWVTDNALFVAEMTDRLRLDYLAFALIFARLNQYSSQSGQPLVSGSRIYPVEILVPSLSDQIKFESIIRKTEQMTAKQEAARNEAEQLFQSLQQQAFA